VQPQRWNYESHALLPMRGSDLEQQSGRLIPGKWLDECNYSGTKELHQTGKLHY
jgi:hypothetical protein